VSQDNQRSKALRHSRLAIASLGFALITIGIVAWLWRIRTGEATASDAFTSAYMVRRVLLFGLPLLGLTLGVIASLKDNRRRSIAILGLVLNAFAMIGVVVV
jgi:hypothetical protein